MTVGVIQHLGGWFAGVPVVQVGPNSVVSRCWLGNFAKNLKRVVQVGESEVEAVETVVPVGAEDVGGGDGGVCFDSLVGVVADCDMRSWNAAHDASSG